MTDLFDFKAPRRRFSVIGNPVAHSKSPLIHQAFALQCDIEIEYDRTQVEVGGFDQAVSHFNAHGGAGLNITAPFKVEAWQMCLRGGNSLSERATLAESVNTLAFNDDGSVAGDNTDGIGLVRDIEQNIGFNIAGKSVLLIGAGGATRGVMGPLLQAAPSRLHIVNRTASKATALAAHFSYSNIVSGGGLDSEPTVFDIVINATPASLDGKLPGIGPDKLHGGSMVYDMTYGNEATAFMKWALDQGVAKAVDGLGMLVEQAAESFRIWHDQMPDTQSVIAALRKQ